MSGETPKVDQATVEKYKNMSLDELKKGFGSDVAEGNRVTSGKETPAGDGHFDSRGNAEKTQYQDEEGRNQRVDPD